MSPDHVDDWWRQLWYRQQASGFPDLAGTEIAATIPLSDRLLNEAIAAWLPRPGRFQQILVSAEPGNRLALRVSLARPRFLPPLLITVLIEQQPQLPASSVLGLRLKGLGGLMTLAGTAASVFGVLPAGISIEGDRVFVHLRTILEQHGAESWLHNVERLNLRTERGILIVSVDVRVPPSA